MSRNNNWSRLGFTFAALALFLIAGCGGGRLIPRDLKDYLAIQLKTERRNVDVTQPFRTTIIYRIQKTTVVNARESERELIGKFLEFSQKNEIKDFLNDSLMFLVRLDTNPDVSIKWFATSRDAKAVVEGEITEAEFISRCIKQERWAEELG
jgi:hypothetical protein